MMHRLELLVFVFGVALVILFVATIDWRIAGILAGFALILSAVDPAQLVRRR